MSRHRRSLTALGPDKADKEHYCCPGTAALRRPHATRFCRNMLSASSAAAWHHPQRPAATSHHTLNTSHQPPDFLDHMASSVGPDKADQKHRTVFQAPSLSDGLMPSNLQEFDQCIICCRPRAPATRPAATSRPTLKTNRHAGWVAGWLAFLDQMASLVGPDEADKEHRTVVQAPPLSDGLVQDSVGSGLLVTPHQGTLERVHGVLGVKDLCNRCSSGNGGSKGGRWAV